MTLTVVSSPVQGGDVTADPALNPPLDNGATWQGSYYPTDNVTITAIAKPGYRFVNWTGDAAEIEDATQSTIVIPMHDYYPNTENIQITANFARQPHFPWAWLTGGIVALFLAVPTLAIVVRRRKKHQADTGAP
jgi:uncharacterized repeat protein (TIGR02543 family)